METYIVTLNKEMTIYNSNYPFEARNIYKFICQIMSSGENIEEAIKNAINYASSIHKHEDLHDDEDNNLTEWTCFYNFDKQYSPNEKSVVKLPMIISEPYELFYADLELN